MNLSRSRRLALTVGALVALAPAGTRAPAAAAATTTYCTAVVEVNGIAGSLNDPASAVAGAKKMQAAIKGITPPPAVSRQWAAISKAVDTAAGGKSEALFDDALLPALATVQLDVADRCGFTTVTVTSTENRYAGVPASVKAGVVSFRNINKGKDAHVLNIARRKPGATTTMAEVVKAIAAAQRAGKDPYAVFMTTFDSVNGYGSFAKPGETSADTVRLAPGSYVMIDTVAVGYAGTGPEPAHAEMHLARGMYREFTAK